MLIFLSQIIEENKEITAPAINKYGPVLSLLSKNFPNIPNSISGEIVATATLPRNCKEKKSRFFIIGSTNNENNRLLKKDQSSDP